MARSASALSLSDDTHQLSSAERRQLEERLGVARRRLGSPVYVLVTPKLHGETAAAMADRIFAERALGGSDSSNPVLLLVALAENASAVATGKGNAGIVPELDATRIARRFASERHRLGLSGALAAALDALVSSGEETLARRRPLTAEDDELPPQPRPAGAEPASLQAVPAAAPANGQPAGGAPPGDETDSDAAAGVEKPAGPRRSRLPLAGAIAGLIIFLLAFRRRRMIAAARERQVAPEPTKPRLPKVIDGNPHRPTRRDR